MRQWAIGSRWAAMGEIYRRFSLAAVIDRTVSRNLTTRDTFGNTPMICETVRSASMPECVWGPRKRNPFFRPHVLTRWSPSVTSTPLFRSTVHGEGCMSYGMPMMPSYSPSKFSTCTYICVCMYISVHINTYIYGETRTPCNPCASPSTEAHLLRQPHAGDKCEAAIQ